jgi:hypothetical protein
MASQVSKTRLGKWCILNELLMIDNYQSRSIRAKVREVLLSTWDPIGIAGEPNAQNEYDSYIGPIYDLLVSKAADAALIEYLYWAVHENMGLDAASKEDMRDTVSALRKIDLSAPDF